MKIMHKLVPSESEITMLFELISKPCLANYSNVIEEARVVEEAKIVFSGEFERLINIALNYGLQIGLANANEKDNMMYTSKD